VILRSVHAKTRLPSEVPNIHGSTVALADVQRQLAAGYYYAALAGMCGISCAPHPLRSVLLGEPVLGASVASALASSVQSRERLGSQTARELGMTLAPVPLVLLPILKACGSPQDVPSALLEYRSSRGAVAARELLAEAENVLSDPDIGTKRQERDLRRISRSLGRPLTNDPTAEVMVSLGFVSISQEFGTSGLRNAFHRLTSSRGLRFVDGLRRSVTEAAEIGPELKRVFGDDVAEAWSGAQGIIGAAGRPKSVDVRFEGSWGQMYPPPRTVG